MMRKFLVVRGNIIIGVYACKGELGVTVKDGDRIIEVTEEKKPYKKGEKYKSLWERLWPI